MPRNDRATISAPTADWITLSSLDNDPYTVFGRLRESQPVSWVPALQRYVFTRYDDCRFMETHPEIFTAEQEGHRVERTIGRSMIRRDDPEHGIERRAVNSTLRVKAVQERWRPIFEANAERIISDFIEKGVDADLSIDFATPYAVSNVAALVGLTHIPHTVIARWSSVFMSGAANVTEDATVWDQVREVNKEIDDAIDGVLPYLRKSPDYSILSEMIRAGMPLSTQRANVKLAIAGGINEPKHTITSAVWALSAHPAQLRRATTDPAIFESVFEETVRWLPPVGLVSRLTTSDFEIRGIVIPAGAQVGAALHSANRDPRRFSAADTFDIERDNSGHLAFGAGPHMCAGRWAAQCSVAQVALPMLYHRLPGLAPSSRQSAKFAGWTFRGLQALPVTWDRTLEPSGTGAVAVDKRITLTIIGIENAAEDITRITLGNKNGEKLPPWEPGSHLTVHLPGGLERRYSICTSDPQDKTYQIAVLREPHGRGGSDYMHSHLHQEDTIHVSTPRNNFPMLTSSKYKFIAAGIGITPILPMISSAHRAGADWTLTYLGRSRERMAFIDELAKYGDRVRIWDKAECGRADLPQLVGVPDHATLVYACGPPSLLDDLELLATQWPVGSLHCERFVAGPHDQPAEPFQIHLARQRRTLSVSSTQSIVDALEAAGIAVRTSCMEGTCRTCETRVLKGTPNHRDSTLSAAERAQSLSMMICVSRADSDELTLDL